MDEETYNFEFLVKASTWDEVVRIFKDELNLDRGKRNASDRNINGLFLVHAGLSDTQITETFYSSIMQSSLVAIVSDPRCESIRNEIMQEVSIVETQLRKLLLHVSDIVEDYYGYFSKTLAKDFAKKEDVISVDDLNPITSYLTFDDVITIFGLDLSSWDGQNLTANNLLELLDIGADVGEIRKALKKKIKKNIVWDHISEHVLETNVQWDDIQKDLEQLKKLRNKAAHFRIVTKKDLNNARTLARSIIGKAKKRPTLSAKDLKKLRDATYPQFADVLLGARKVAESLTYFQKDVAATLAAMQPQINAANTIAHSMATIEATNLQALRTLLGHGPYKGSSASENKGENDKSEDEPEAGTQK